MTEGSKVRVYPHGSPDQYAIGTVEVLRGNELTIVVIFKDRPIFAGPSNRKRQETAFYATRAELNGKPWGPWNELLSGGHYEIEEEP
jgi:hypothetical protein